jgi:branched-chain amino acid transport system permease protein
MNVTMIIMQILNGLTIAAICILLGSGLTIVLGLQRIINAAHGVFYMLGAYFSITLISAIGLNFWLSLPLGFAGTFLVGAAMEVSGIRALVKRKREHIQLMIFTLGIALAGGEIVKVIWGAVPQLAEVPESLQGVIMIGPVVYPKYWLFVMACATVVMLVIWLFFAHTGLGILVRAVAMNSEMAQALGTNAPRINTLVFGFGTGIAGIAGVLAAPILGVDPNMGMELLMILFVVIIFGGLGSLMGVVVSGIIVGLVLAFGTALISGMVAKILVFALMIAILITKPLGLFGKSTATE